MSGAQLGYVRFGAQDPEQWKTLLCDMLGMQLLEGSADEMIRMKMDDHPFRYLIEPHEEDKLLGMGWELSSQAEWDALLDRLSGAGVEVQDGTTDGAELRCVTAYATASDPDGNPLEFYYGRTGMGKPYEPQLDIKGFMTRHMGLGHIVIPAPQQDTTHAFYRDLMGFGLSDILTLPPMFEEGPEQRIVFMHGQNPRHHSLALYNFPIPSGCVHIMAEVGSLDEVGQALDRVKKAGLPLLASLGRHENDEMVSFYVFGPGGIAVEFGYDGKTIDPKTYKATSSTLGDIWGHDYQLFGGQ
ncbi:VOC family protein [Henriciella litoralis]|uniref:VOC family protein n=1 Tax=Henriciella litoralis TaxID=568102 RepID=UPI000A0706EC|nr:VOC family protein [Henriciella litoralis]